MRRLRLDGRTSRDGSWVGISRCQEGRSVDTDREEGMGTTEYDFSLALESCKAEEVHAGLG